ncbi:maleylpyruvate isomerase family mycothiol-dependent enzyme [Yaniella halotolerans]|uniref:maleylpyruvate isomerase family mycothiol-dependent enzyme n=1 Tax=Yaniella halotolerans TaxID=225453 RepID=UPI000A05C285|nr:maleylpyruvate isomerase family mycothiol-dependent enzyme [Yaniella halotolerans]
MTNISAGPHSQDGDDFVAASRAAFVAALYAAGPNEPTLVDQWQTQHLAASVYLRENPHQVTSRASGTSSATMNTAIEKLAEESSSRKAFYNLVRKIGDGAESQSAGQRPSLFKRIRNSMKQRRHETESLLLEFFVHTEDIRRAQSRWAPRKLSDTYASALFEQLREQARKYYGNAKTGYVLVRTNGERIVAKRGTTLTYVTGPAGELVLHALGRPDHALVLIDRP